jgi:hypothetical protein
VCLSYRSHTNLLSTDAKICLAAGDGECNYSSNGPNDREAKDSEQWQLLLWRNVLQRTHVFDGQVRNEA